MQYIGNVSFVCVSYKLNMDCTRQVLRPPDESDATRYSAHRREGEMIERKVCCEDRIVDHNWDCRGSIGCCFGTASGVCPVGANAIAGGS